MDCLAMTYVHKDIMLKCIVVMMVSYDKLSMESSAQYCSKFVLRLLKQHGML